MNTEPSTGDVMGAGHFQEYEEMYLKTLYHEHEKVPGRRVRNSELAEYLDVSPASATEMVQRLAKNGFVEYVPYKGVLLTGKGLELGKMMKRRHRLAEVLLNILPFEGDIHETACRLEHAFNDDLEVCISLLLGNPDSDPSGSLIPSASDKIAERITRTPTVSILKNLHESKSGEITLILTTADTRNVLLDSGLKIGDVFEKTESGYSCNGNPVEISDDLASRIVLRLIS